MKVAFTNFAPTSKVKTVLLAHQCQIVSPSEAHVFLTTLSSMASLKEVSNTEKIQALFVSTDLLRNTEFQQFITSLKQPAFVFALETWEEQLLCAIPSIRAYLSMKTAKQTQERELAQLSQKIEQLANQFNEDVELATKIHHQLIPSSDLTIPGITITSKYLPASGLGGDYFDVFELHDKKHLGVLIADSQTHGMASALLSSLLKIRLDDFKDRGSFSQNLMNHLNQELYQIHQSKLPGLDLVFGLLDRTTLTFDYVSAGSLKPLIWNYPHFLELPLGQNPALGLSPTHQYSNMTYQLRPGDLLFFYTNGLEAVFGHQGNSLTNELASLFTSIKKMDPLDFQTELLAQINRFQEEKTELPDDITLIQLMVDKKALYLTQSK